MLHSTRWTTDRIKRRLELISPWVYRNSEPISPFRYMKLDGPESDPLVAPEVDDHDWPTIAPDTYWGGSRTSFMLRGEFTVPASWPADAIVALDLNIGDAKEFEHPEALVYIDGEAYATCDRNHHEILLPARYCDGKPHMLALHGWTGNMNPARSGVQLLMHKCSAVQIDQPTRDLVTATRVALGVANNLTEDNPVRVHLLDGLASAFNIIDTLEPIGDDFYKSVAAALDSLRAAIDKAGPPLDVDLVATGHAHIDVAWLWPLAQTRRKAGRTFHTVLRLMEQFPDYHFTQSQPQLYEYIRQDYPELFEGIKERVAERRWEPIGDMWVEADCNLSGPESLARQFLLGRSFFKQEFGRATSGVLWLPDVFGYSWALPQLIKQAGLEYFFTIKIGWSQYNRLPYDSFWWQGLDGTRVLTHFSPTPDSPGSSTSTYNAAATPEEVLGTWTNFRQKDLAGAAGDEIPPLLMAFGFGDGGGGPTREMLENLNEMKSYPALPRVSQKPVSEFFRDLEEKAGDRLPTWNGELYLELHRGTYTTQSRNKRANRKSEFLLHDAEFLAAMASIYDTDYSYPHDQFTHAWRLICLNQFHDIIPGSSITQVYIDSQAQYQEIEQIGTQVRDEAIQSLAAATNASIFAANATSFARSDLAFFKGELRDGESILLADGTSLPQQKSEGGTWLDLGGVAPFSLTSLQVGRNADSEIRNSNTLTATPTLLENNHIRVELNADGDITRIFDKSAQREVLPHDAIANQFQAFEDRPMNWDAWDIDIFYSDKRWLADPATEVKVVESGQLRATLEITRRILHSAYTQRISLSHNSPQLDFSTTIDWRERHVLLKVAFPVDLLAVSATYEIQWGNVERPTHHNTSWDWARFETCAQKWVDVSERDYGVSVLNDCKYGHDIHNNVIRVSLLRSPTNPDPEADQGTHTFAYSLLPHAGSWSETTVAAAYALNDPIIIADVRDSTAQGNTTNQIESASLVQVNKPNIVIETIKRAEDGNGIIARLYESQRRRGRVTLKTAFGLAEVYTANLLEENQAKLEAQDSSVNFDVHPYEIVTLRLIPAT